MGTERYCEAEQGSFPAEDFRELPDYGWVHVTAAPHTTSGLPVPPEALEAESNRAAGGPSEWSAAPAPPELSAAPDDWSAAAEPVDDWQAPADADPDEGSGGGWAPPPDDSARGGGGWRPGGGGWRPGGGPGSGSDDLL